MKNVIIRALSGIVYIVLIVGAILWGPLPFLALSLIFAALGLHEFFVMSHVPDGDKSRYYLVEAIDITFGLLLVACSRTSLIFSVVIVIILGLYFLTRATVSLTDVGTHAYREVAKSMLGVMYIAFPLMMLNMLYQVSYLLVLIMFIMIWLNDTGAFCFGITLGKHRLCERLSPKKSWEGFWGGMACCIAFGAACTYIFSSLHISIWLWMAMGAVVSLFATWGDLFESMLKRTVHVKDSGKLMPGHGGILDRIDSLLFVAPASLILIYIVQPI